jgi:hypothetical protein
MTKEFPNDPITNMPARLLIQAWGFFRLYGLGMSHSSAWPHLISRPFFPSDPRIHYKA